MRIALFVLAALALAGCDKGGKYDLAADPKAVATPGITDKDLAMWGVHLGDAEDKIPADQVLSRDTSTGVLECKGDRRFRVSKGKVVQFALYGKSLEPLGITSMAQLEQTLGKPDRAVPFMIAGREDSRDFTYEKRRLIVFWDFNPPHVSYISVGEEIK